MRYSRMVVVQAAGGGSDPVSQGTVRRDKLGGQTPFLATKHWTATLATSVPSAWKLLVSRLYRAVMLPANMFSYTILMPDTLPASKGHRIPGRSHTRMSCPARGQ